MTSLVRSGAIVTLGTSLSRLTGLARISVIAYVVGFTRLTDGYNLANATPNILYELLLGGVLTATVVPIFVDHFERDDEEATSAVVSVAVAVLAAISVLGVVLAPLIARLYTMRITDADVASQRELVTSLLRWFMPQILLYGMVALATAALHARRRFAAPAFAPALNNMVVIAVFLLLHRWAGGTPSLGAVLDDRSLLVLIGLGTTAGVALMAFAILPALKRSGIRLRLNLDWRHPAIREILRLSGWTVGYVASNQLALWIVILLALEHAGDLSAYQTAFVFFQLPHGLLAVSLMTTVGPELASRSRNLPALRIHFRDTLRLLLMAMTPAAVGYVVLARPIVGALLERGAFANASAVRTADVLAIFAVALVPFSVYLYALRGFYALRNTRTPFWLNLFENGVNIAFAVALVPALEVQGLALSYAIAYGVAAIVAMSALSRRIGNVFDGPVMRTVTLTAASAGVMAVVVWLFDRMVAEDLASPLRAITGTALGVFVYGGMVAMTQRHDLRSLWRNDRPITLA